MDIKKLAIGMLVKKLVGNTAGNNDVIGDVMGKLLGGGDAGGDLDLGSLVNGLKAKGMGDVASSWLGDGDNAEISADQLKDVLGQEKISAAAAQLGTDEGSLLDSLQDALPQIVDQSSKGGSLLGSLGGLSGIAKKLL